MRLHFNEQSLFICSAVTSNVYLFVNVITTTYSKRVGLINVNAMVNTSKIAIRAKYHPNALTVAMTTEEFNFHVLVLAISVSDFNRSYFRFSFSMDPF